MKKITLLFCLIAIVCTSMQAQEFAPIGAKWTYSWLTSLIAPDKEKDEGYTQIESVEEVILQGKNCKRLTGRIYSPMGIYYDLEDIIIYQEGDTIYRLATDGVFDILYIFNAAAGDTWETREYDYLLQKYRDVTIMVNSTTTSVINGLTYRDINVCATDNRSLSFGCNTTSGPIRISEKIGPFSFLLLQNYGYDGPINIGLRCYEDEQIGSYSTGFREDCFLVEGNPTCFCLAEYKPVCGADGRTYGNRCQAECAGVAVVSEGECSREPVVCNPADFADYDSFCSKDPLIKEIIHYVYQDTNYIVYLPNIDPDRSFNLGVGIYNCDKGYDVYYLDRFENTSITSIDDFFKDAEKIETLFELKNCPTIPQINIDYPLIELYGLFDFENCTTESIEVYKIGFQPYYLVTDAAGTTILYNGQGKVWCTNSSNYDCVAAYQLGSPVAFYDCGEVNNSNPNPTPDSAPDESDSIFDDYPWLSTYISSTCSSGSVSVYQSGAYQFLFVQSEGDSKLYFEDGTPYCTNTGTFDCVSAYNLGELIATWTCGESDEMPTPPTPNTPYLYDDYPWLKTVLDPNNCQGKSIEVYDQGSYAFLFIRTSATEGELYLDNGNFYCTSKADYDCLFAYGLATPTSTWTCGSLLGEASTARTREMVKDASFQVHPNPTFGRVIVQVPVAQREVQQLQVFDMLGRVIKEMEIPISDFATSIEVDLTTEMKGVFFMELRSKNRRVVKKVIKK